MHSCEGLWGYVDEPVDNVDKLLINLWTIPILKKRDNLYCGKRIIGTIIRFFINNVGLYIGD